MTPDGRVVRAMVLSGGSAYASYEVGLLKALLRGESSATGYKPLSPDVYVGTSGGAFNAAMMTSRPGRDVLATLDFLEHVWVDRFTADPATCREGAIRVRGDISQYANLRCLSSNPLQPLSRIAEDTAYLSQFVLSRASNFLSSSPRTIGRRALESVDIGAMISNDEFVRVIHQVIDLEGIRTSDTALRVSTTSWKTGELRVFANADMSDSAGHAAIEASAAFPGTRPVQIEGKPFVDGGYLQNTPLRPAISAYGDELHVVFMDPDTKDIPVRQLDNTFDVLDKLYHIMQAFAFKWDIGLARAVNRAVDFVDRSDLDPSQSRGVVDVFRALIWPTGAEETPLRQTVIHLYHPRENLGGALGLLNFDRSQIMGLIAKGYADAVAHDCVASGCVVPEGGVGRAGHQPRGTVPRTDKCTHSTNEVADE